MTFENVRSEFGNRGVGEARKLIRKTLEQYRLMGRAEKADMIEKALAK